MNETKKVVLITGVSSGIGKACAKYLSDKGYKVFGAIRKISKTSTKSYDIIEMDVNDDKSVKEAVNQLVEKTGRIDILVNNAGYGISGSIEETSIIKAKEQLETNFFGIHRVSKEVLPIMRKQKEGFIINISSIGGIMGLPFQGLYCASKFALEGWSESLRMEVESYGIRVVLIEPGDIKTSFTQKREKITSNLNKSPYKKKAIQALTIVEKDEQSGPLPSKVALLLYKIINKKSPKIRYKVGTFSQILICYLKKILPNKSIQWILMKYYKIK